MPLSPKLQGPKQLSRFRRQLLAWYARNQRGLPWRGERDPYRIWVSEVMLQQTRVAVAIARYPRFLRRFPNLARLARAPLSQVLAEWSGLGYYRRARHLHAAARELMRRNQPFPTSAGELRQLPGIGRYTATAVASIAFDEPVAVVDGNVERVIRRLLPGASSCWDSAQVVLDPDTPGDFNQAMMELGATVCLPVKPACHACPVNAFCPQPASAERERRAPQHRNRRSIAYAVTQCAGRIQLVQRPQNASLMSGMWELPVLHDMPNAPHFRLRHSITNTDYDVLVRVRSQSRASSRGGGRWFRPEQLNKVPITGLTRKILKRAGILRIEITGDD